MGTVPRPPEQRAIANARYNQRNASTGLVKLNILVPLVRLGELDALLVAWRAEARAQIEYDRPLADQILIIHSICRTLPIPLPVRAFTTRHSAKAWLKEKQPLLAGRRLQKPRHTQVA